MAIYCIDERGRQWKCDTIAEAIRLANALEEERKKRESQSDSDKSVGPASSQAEG